MKIAGLIYDNSVHFLDHLAPFCVLINCPLIVSEPSIADLARDYYPDLTVIEKDFFDILLPEITITCDSTPLLSATFLGQKTKPIWLPHGRSDKGKNTLFFEALSEEKFALIYGDSMEALFKEKNLKAKTFKVGNFRLEYFKKHQSFYKKKVTLPEQNGILYAPSWDDAEKSCSFWSSFGALSKKATDFPLLIKLHPNTIQKYGPEIEMFFGKYGSKKVHLLPNISPIYPILSQIKAYIGDMSSIGYDFLSFEKPMYFIGPKKALPLYECGACIDPKTFSYINFNPKISEQKALYQTTFSKAPDFQNLKENLLCALLD